MKKFKGFLVLAMMSIMLTGCVKFNANMEIRKDKSMVYSIVYAVDSSLFGDTEIISEDDKKEIEEQGYKVEPYEKDNYKGFTISKKLANIDEVSSLEDTYYDVSGIMDKDANKNEMFSVKKGFLKNTYTAKFSFNSNEGNLGGDSSMTGGYGLGEDVTYDDDTSDSDGEVIDDDSSSELSSALSSLTSSMDLSFNVKLPYSAISNNATTVNNDGKDLTWSLSSGNTDEILFSFELYNMVNVYIACGIIAVIVVLAIAMILNRKRA